MKKETVFISYSQKDIERVSLFASLMAKNGYDVWMDVKSISLGENIISAIAKALDKIDIYMLFISNNSNASPWVAEEINIALTHSIKRNKPRIIPVLLDNCQIPEVLSGRLYLDARKSILSALSQLDREFKCDNTNVTNPTTTQLDKPILTGVIFGLSKKTIISIGPLCNDFSQEDLLNERQNIQKELRKRANGILMNFVAMSDFDLQSPVPKYKNGVYEETVEQVEGDVTASIGERITAKATIFNPDPKKVSELVNNKLDKLHTTSLTYIFTMPLLREGFDKACMQRLQDNYPIISYDIEDGATIEYEGDFFLSIKCTLEQIRIKLHTQYESSFSKRATQFLPFEFANWLTKGIK